MHGNTGRVHSEKMRNKLSKANVCKAKAPSRKAKGIAHGMKGRGFKQIAARIMPGAFREIGQIADANGVFFAEQVRVLLDEALSAHRN